MTEQAIKIEEVDVEAKETYPIQRDCTRCDGSQHLISSYMDMGKYVCDTCTMSIGFDAHCEKPEFLLDRGLPSRYTKSVFGLRLTKEELRIDTAKL